MSPGEQEGGKEAVSAHKELPEGTGPRPSPTQSLPSTPSETKTHSCPRACVKWGGPHRSCAPPAECPRSLDDLSACPEQAQHVAWPHWAPQLVGFRGPRHQRRVLAALRSCSKGQGGHPCPTSQG